MIIETKFSNGDVVYLATYRTEMNKAKCPECVMGRLKIEGKDYTVACYACHGRGEVGDGPKFVANSRRLTVGQVGVIVTQSRGCFDHIGDNYKAQSAREERYMCEETGICSGSVYYAETLFATEPEALAHGEILALQAQRRYAEEREREEKERLAYLAREFAATETEADGTTIIGVTP